MRITSSPLSFALRTEEEEIAGTSLFKILAAAYRRFSSSASLSTILALWIASSLLVVIEAYSICAS
jgi:hypothetical protein